MQQAQGHVEALLAEEDAREDRGLQGYEKLPPVPTLALMGKKHKWKMGAQLSEICGEGAGGD